MTSAQSEEPRLVKVHTASGQLQAQVIKTRLESEGIPVLLRYDSASIVFGLTVDGLGEVEVLVPERLAERARKVLAQPAPLDSE
ncbi:MAG: DUF2007 domain-containing protein [Anaerolineae bacterium]